MKEKDTIIVVDTSLLMNHPGIMRNSKWCDFIAPMAALRQLDGLKDNENPVTRQRARIASRTIEEQRISIVKRYVKINDLDNWGDNTIIGTALKVKEENPDKRVLLLTTDRNMRLVAGSYDLEAIDFWDFVKKDNCPAMKPPLWIKIWGYIGLGMIASAFGVFLFNELMSVAMFFGGCLLLGLGQVPVAAWNNSRLRQSVIEYYEGDSDQDDDFGHMRTDEEKNLDIGITDPNHYIFH